VWFVRNIKGLDRQTAITAFIEPKSFFATLANLSGRPPGPVSFFPGWIDASEVGNRADTSVGESCQSLRVRASEPRRSYRMASAGFCISIAATSRTAMPHPPGGHHGCRRVT
jgi:hypothetical protein